MDFKDGFGRAAKPGDELRLRYAGADYKTGEEYLGSWLSTGVVIELGAKTREVGLETGLRGMKVGGRRELIVPSNLANGYGAVVFLIDLLEVKPS